MQRLLQLSYAVLQRCQLLPAHSRPGHCGSSEDGVTGLFHCCLQLQEQREGGQHSLAPATPGAALVQRLLRGLLTAHPRSPPPRRGSR